jgi:hypothetical protein
MSATDGTTWAGTRYAADGHTDAQVLAEVVPGPLAEPLDWAAFVDRVGPQRASRMRRKVDFRGPDESGRFSIRQRPPEPGPDAETAEIIRLESEAADAREAARAARADPLAQKIDERLRHWSLIP